jgi:uncharacterized protein YndB with AHSA1/START domain
MTDERHDDSSPPLRHEGRMMDLEIKTSASPEHAWLAWADPQKISQWFVDSARGEAKRGGTMTWIFDKFAYEIPYRVVDAIPGKLFALGGELPGRPPFLLEVRISRDEGETLIRVVNSGFLDGGKWDDEYEGVLSGWQMSLALLKYYLERHYGEPKRSFLALQSARYPMSDVRSWFVDPDHLGEWLTASAAETRPPDRIGAPVRIPLSKSDIIEGDTLALTKSEVAVSWERERCVLELKAFKMGPNDMVAIRGTTWGANPSRVAEIEALCTRAIERLAHRLDSVTLPVGS